MTIQEALTRLNRHATGQASAVDPENNASTYRTFVDALDTAQQVWGEEPDIQWDVLRVFYEIPLTTANVYSVADISNISTGKLDFVAIEYTDMQSRKVQSRYQIVSPEYFNNFTGSDGGDIRICTISNNELQFPSPFSETDPRVLNSANIKVPYYRRPDRITTDTPLTDTIQCPSPNFVIYYAAGELVSQGFIKEDRFSEFMGKASHLMTEMKLRTNNFKKNVVTRFRPSGRSTSGF